MGKFLSISLASCVAAFTAINAFSVEPAFAINAAGWFTFGYGLSKITETLSKS